MLGLEALEEDAGDQPGGVPGDARPAKVVDDQGDGGPGVGSLQEAHGVGRIEVMQSQRGEDEVIALRQRPEVERVALQDAHGGLVGSEGAGQVDDFMAQVDSVDLERQAAPACPLRKRDRDIGPAGADVEYSKAPLTRRSDEALECPGGDSPAAREPVDQRQVAQVRQQGVTWRQRSVQQLELAGLWWNQEAVEPIRGVGEAGCWIGGRERRMRRIARAGWHGQGSC